MPKAKQTTTARQGGEERLDRILAEVRSGRATSPEPKLLIKNIVDVSGSMHASGALDQARAGVTQFVENSGADEVIKYSLEYSLDVFAERVATVRPYGPITGWSPGGALAELPDVGNGTRIGDAVLHALDDMEGHRARLREQGMSLRYAMIFLFTDGEDPAAARLDEAARRIRALEERDFRFFAIGVEGADMSQLARLAPEPVRLATVSDFTNFFRWLLVTSRRVSASRPGEPISAPDPFKSERNPEGWAEKWTMIG